MSVSEVATLVGALALTGLLAWYFFGPKKSHQAELSEGVQVITVTVKSGYSPDVIQVASGVPVRMLFDRQESGDCSSRVVLPHFHVNQALPALEVVARIPVGSKPNGVSYSPLPVSPRPATKIELPQHDMGTSKMTH